MANGLFDQEDDEIDYLTELTKPGAKYDRTKYTDDSELLKALAKGKYHGDKTLAFQLSKNDELNAELGKMDDLTKTQAKLEDLLTKYERTSMNNDSANNQSVSSEPLDLSTVKKLIASEFQETEAKKREQANLAVVETRLRERFGENAASTLKDKMNTLGLSTDDLKFLAKKSPEAVLNTLGLSSQAIETYHALPSSNVRTDSFKPSVEIRDAVYYEKMRRENKAEYFSEKMSVQRLKDMEHPDFLKRLNERRLQNYS